jgi:hypothetical protein
MNELTQSRWFPIALLSASNIFMIFADLPCSGFWRSMVKTVN